MKTPEEIKKGLECANNCSENGMTCSRCPYLGRDCSDLHPDALAYIRQLEVDSARQDAYILRLENELEAVKRERDAAVNMLESLKTCDTCIHKVEAETTYISTDCFLCTNMSEHKFRGVTEGNDGNVEVI